MNKPTSRIALFLGACVATLVAADVAVAEVSAETKFVFNTFSFLVHGFLVMFMAAGFAMLESGLVRVKNTATICLKNIALYSVAGIMYYLIGYNLMYVDVAGWMELPGSFSGIDSSPSPERGPEASQRTSLAILFSADASVRSAPCAKTSAS